MNRAGRLVSASEALVIVSGACAFVDATSAKAIRPADARNAKTSQARSDALQTVCFGPWALDFGAAQMAFPPLLTKLRGRHRKTEIANRKFRRRAEWNTCVTTRCRNRDNYETKPNLRDRVRIEVQMTQAKVYLGSDLGL